MTKEELEKENTQAILNAEDPNYPTKDQLIKYYNFYVEDQEEKRNVPLNYEEWHERHADELYYKLKNINK